MSKNLKQDYENLRLENQKLKTQIEDLNENTVINSMNDMKKEYEQLKQESISLDTYLDLRELYKVSIYTNKSITNINDIIINDLNTLIETFDNDNLTQSYKKMRTETLVNNISSYLSLNQRILDTINDNCSCNFND